ncbi:hypothetical protein ACHQM5_003227 [Ranunculus cassubicifolius]
MGLVSMSLFKVLVALVLLSLGANSMKMSPAPAPAPMSVLPVRSLVAVQGVVYLRACKYLKWETLMGAIPISGATVKLVCNNRKKPITMEAITNKNGYFFMIAPKKVTTYGSHKCKVFLVSSPYSTQKPSNLNWGVTGAYLRRERKQPVPTPSFTVFTVGPFGFSPTKCPK